MFGPEDVTNDIEQSERVSYILAYGCTCHVSPPCPWCEKLSEVEADILYNHGIVFLKEYLSGMLNVIDMGDIHGDG